MTRKSSQIPHCQPSPGVTFSRRLPCQPGTTHAGGGTGRGRRTVTGLSRFAALMGLALAAGGALPGCAPLVIGGVGGVAMAASEHRGLKGFASDTEIRASINHLWFQHNINLASGLGLTVDHGRVLLTGRVPNAQSRQDAVRLAWQAEGVKEVINEIQINDGGGILDSAGDTWISTQLRTKITIDGDIHSQNYSIDTVDGVVYLMGTATTQAELDRVIEHARSVANVQRVVNYVRLISSL